MNDIFPDDGAQNGRFRPFAELLAALRFLTRLPIPFARTIDPPAMTRALRFFAVAGGLIGALNGLVLLTVKFTHMPSLIAAAATCIFGALITGALHEDGLADTADGLFGGKTREDRLVIMRDSRVGTYGALALGFAMLVRVGAYQALLARPSIEVILVMIAVGAFSRAMMVDMMWATRPARADGLSVMVGRPGRNTALFAILTGAALMVWAGSVIRIESGFIAMIIAVMITGMIRRTATRLIGGQTGDVCGAVQVLTEIAMLAIFTTMIG